ncbi:MAG: glycogen/starch synthase [Patescibacteria group bacterium]
MKALKIVSIASEVHPYSKTGGLADVTRSLPKALHRLGHEVIIITPFYGKAIDPKAHHLELIYSDVKLKIDDQTETPVSYYRGELMPGLKVYFVGNEKYFSRHKKLYGSDHENARFYLFDVACLKLISLLKFPADIIHCHDWHTGLIPYLKKTRFKHSQTLAGAATVFTIHNLVFQLGHNWWEVPLKYRDKGQKSLPKFSDKKLEHINFAKRGILHADVVNTVSETYAKEILRPTFGQDLHRILRNHQDRLFGIVNGIDYKDFNPINDLGLVANYDYRKIKRKKINKAKVQKLFGLRIDPEAPVLCTTSRVTFQKGFELIAGVTKNIMDLGAQLIIIGSGDKQYLKEFARLAKQYPKQLAVVPSQETLFKYETLIYAGSDIFLLPSHQEPCGINQMKSFRYGCVPIVRQTGGLNDTVENFEPANKRGTGFTFKNYDQQEFLIALTRALETYKHKKVWRDLACRGMKSSFSWELPAKEYIELYQKAIKNKN